MVRAITIRHRRTRGIPLHMVDIRLRMEDVWNLQGTQAPFGMRNARGAGDRVVVALAVAEARRLRPRGRRLEGRRPEGAALVGGLLQIKVAHAKGSNRARSAGGWGQPDPVARRHGRALEHVRRLAVVDDDARAVGVARQGDVLREQAMAVHELELEV